MWSIVAILMIQLSFNSFKPGNEVLEFSFKLARSVIFGVELIELKEFSEFSLLSRLTSLVIGELLPEFCFSFSGLKLRLPRVLLEC